MLIETLTVQIHSHKVHPEGKDWVLTCPHSPAPIRMTAAQNEYLQLLDKGMTIEQLVSHYVHQHRPFGFKELYDLIEKLTENNVIGTHQFKTFFERLEDHASTKIAPTTGASRIKNWNRRSLLTLPFFRTLDSEVATSFVAGCELIEVAERTRIVSDGETSRDLYVLLEGGVSIYRKDDRGRRQLITIIPAGSIFGEGSFLLNKPRSADIISNVPSILAKIPWNERDFSPLLKKYSAAGLQQRFWVLQGLLSSPLFHSIPSETVDLFMFVGKSKTLSAGEVICREGQPGDSFFVLIQGEVRIEKDHRLLRTLKQGDIFGEIALMVSDGVRIATAISVTQCLLLEVHKEEFFKVLSQNLVLAKEIEMMAYKRYSATVR